MQQSLITTPPGERAITLKESYVEICDGDREAAYLLSVLEFWTNHESRERRIRKRENVERAKDGRDDMQPVNEGLWVRRTHDEIYDDAMGLISKRKIAPAARKLEDMGFIETGFPFRNAEGDAQDSTKYYRLRIDRINDRMRQIVVSTQTTDQKREERIQEAQEEDTGADDSKWTDDDWQYKYACRWWERQDELGGGRIPYTWRQKKEKILQKWADAFDWVVRVREIPKETLDTLIVWLFEEEGWWIPTANLVAPTKFKEKNDQDMWRVQEFIMKMKSRKTSGTDYSPPEEGGEVPQWKRDKIIEANEKVTREDWLTCGWTEDGNQKVYAYHPQNSDTDEQP